MKKTFLEHDLKRNKVITLALVFFIAISSLLGSSAVNVFLTCFSSLEQFFELSKTPHLIQMHSGEIDKAKLEEFAKKHDYIRDYELVTLLNVDASALYISDTGMSENGSIMGNAFVVQNENFDFILSMDNEIIHLDKGEVALPAYYSQKYDIAIGDKIKLKIGTDYLEFKIKTFSRDSQMNSSFISSKRILVSSEDYDKIQFFAGDSITIEYIIEYRVSDESKIAALEAAYKKESMPSNGPLITYSQIKLITSLTDAIMATLIIFATFLLVFISVLCIRFTLIITIDEDYSEIGIMKGIGIPSSYIESLYYIKYLVVAIFGHILGSLLSLVLTGEFEKNISLYMGIAPKNALHYVFQLLGGSIPIMLILVLCRRVLKTINRLSVVDVLRSNGMETSSKPPKLFSIYKNSNHNTNILMGLKYIFSLKKMHLVMASIFAISTFLMIIPLNFLTTFQSPEFIRYMGVSKSDVRIDLQYTDDINDKRNAIATALEHDNQVEKYSFYSTYSGKSTTVDGDSVYLNFETGNYTDFSLSYTQGEAPTVKTQIAISSLAAKELEKGIGDTLEVTVGKITYELSICGIYQDITNGGKSAKVTFAIAGADIMWYMINIDFLDGISIAEKKAEYTQQFPSARITDLKDYIYQSLGNIIEQLKHLTIVMAIISLLIASFTTIVFVKLLIIKSKKDIAIMHSIGFCNRDIRQQYLVRLLVVMLVGIILGIIMTNSLGQSVLALMLSSMGASQISFIVNHALAYVLYPFLLIITVTLSAVCSTKQVKNIKIIDYLMKIDKNWRQN